MNTDLVNRAVLSAPGEGKDLGLLKLRLSAAQTGGALEAFEHSSTGSPPPHIHRDHDELFYIIEGSVTFTQGQEDFVASAGSLVFIPRGIRHAFKPNPGARILFFVMPAGMEGFFKEMGQGFAAGRPEPDVRAALAGKYDSWPTG